MTISNADSAIAAADAPSISCWVIVDPRLVEYDSFDALLAAFAGTRLSGPCGGRHPTARRPLNWPPQPFRPKRLASSRSVMRSPSAPLPPSWPTRAYRSASCRSIRAPTGPLDRCTDRPVRGGCRRLGGSTSVLDLMKVTIDSATPRVRSSPSESRAAWPGRRPRGAPSGRLAVPNRCRDAPLVRRDSHRRPAATDLQPIGRLRDRHRQPHIGSAGPACRRPAPARLDAPGPSRSRRPEEVLVRHSTGPTPCRAGGREPASGSFWSSTMSSRTTSMGRSPATPPP